MAHAAVVIVGADDDFTQPIAEQVRNELGLSCEVVADFAHAAGAGVVIASEEPPVQEAHILVVRSKPLRMAELLQRVLQLRQQPPDELVLAEDIVLKVRQKQLCRKGASAELTDKEIAIIQHLKSAGVEGLSKEQLLKLAWGIESSLDTHTLETHIYRLRNKIRDLMGREQAGEEALICATAGGYAMVVK